MSITRHGCLDPAYLNGVKLEDEMKINITWPDKTVTFHKIVMDKRQETTSAMGHDYDYTKEVPTININHFGHYMKIDLETLNGFRGVKINETL